MPRTPVGPRALSWSVGLGVLVVHLVMVRDVAGPLVYADELGYIAAARYFAPGVPDVQMLSSFYHFGYGLLLTPLVVLFDEPDRFYRAATLGNAGIAVSATALFHRLVLRWGAATAPPAAALSALAFGLTPSLLTNTSIVWAETTLVLVLVLLVAGLHRLLERPSAAVAVVVGSLAAFAFGVHPRAIAMTVGAGIVVVFAAMTQRLPPRMALVVLGSTLAGLTLVVWTNRALRAALYTEGSIDQSGAGVVESIVDHPGQWLAGLGGSLWYQLLASAGLAAVGVWFLTRRLVGSELDRSGPIGAKTDPVALFVLLSLGLSWAVGAVISVSDDPRIDQYFYGRYLDVFAPLLVGLGVLQLSRWRTSPLALLAPAGAAAVGFGGWLVSTRGSSGFFSDAAVVPVNVPVATALHHLADTWNPGLLGLVGAAWCGATLIGFRSRPWVGTTFFVVGAVLLAEVTLDRAIRPASHAGEDRSGLAAPIERLAEGGVVFLAAPYEFWSLNGLQFWADDVQFALETHCPTAAADLVVAPVDDVRYGTWAIMADDLDLGRQVLLDTSGASATSRSVEVDIIERTVDENQILLVVDIANLDGGRPLRLGGELTVHARYLRDGRVVTSIPIEIDDVVDQPPLTRARHELQLGVPSSMVGDELEVRLDVHEVDRGWLSESPCGQSSFDVVGLDLG